MIKNKNGFRATHFAPMAFLLALAMLDAKPVGAAQPIGQVLVTNGPDAPVPVSPQGTTTVTGTVSIGNLPVVALAGGDRLRWRHRTRARQ